MYTFATQAKIYKQVPQFRDIPSAVPVLGVEQGRDIQAGRFILGSPLVRPVISATLAFSTVSEY